MDNIHLFGYSGKREFKFIRKRVNFFANVEASEYDCIIGTGILTVLGFYLDCTVFESRI